MLMPIYCFRFLDSVSVFGFHKCSARFSNFWNRSFLVSFFGCFQNHVSRCSFQECFCSSSFSKPILEFQIGFGILEIADPFLKIISISDFDFRKYVFYFWFQKIVYLFRFRVAFCLKIGFQKSQFCFLVSQKFVFCFRDRI